MKIRIPLIVTENGKWASVGFSSAEPDWDWIDEICDPENALMNPQRYFVEIEVELPPTKTIIGVAEPAS